jgi:hypothetical protein
MTSKDQLAIISQAITEHAHELAHEQWTHEQAPILEQILSAAGYGKADTIMIDEEALPVERLVRAIRESFIERCSKDFMVELTLQTLMDQGSPGAELPTGAGVCRELARYPAADMRKIWTHARELALAKGTAEPDSMTVREAAVQIVGTPRAKERASRELIEKIEGIGREIVGLAAQLLRSAPHD